MTFVGSTGGCSFAPRPGYSPVPALSGYAARLAMSEQEQQKAGPWSRVPLCKLGEASLQDQEYQLWKVLEEGWFGVMGVVGRPVTPFLPLHLPPPACLLILRLVGCYCLWQVATSEVMNVVLRYHPRYQAFVRGSMEI